MEIILELQTLNNFEKHVHDRALRRAQNYHSSEAEMLASIDEADRFRLFERFGLRSTLNYCCKYLGMSEDVGSCFIRVARASRKFPELNEAIGQQKFSIWVAQRISPHMTDSNKKEWLLKAATLSKAELEKEIAKAAPATVRDSVKPLGKNRNKVTFGASDELVRLRTRVRELENQRTGRVVSVEEAEMAMAKDYLFHHDPVCRAERSAGKSARPMPTRKGERRTDAPSAARHLVNLRDRGYCRIRMPDGTLCGSQSWVEIHHILPIAMGGTHDPENLITVCSAHHAQLHDDHDLTV